MSAPLVLLHGWGLTPAVWQPLRTALAAPREIHAPALPGHGGAPAAAATLDAWADALAPQIPPGAALCGWSLGALLAMRLAARTPGAISKLILIGASPCFVRRTDWAPALDADTANGFRHEFSVAPSQVLRRFIALQALGDAARRPVSAALNAALTAVDDSTAPQLGDALSVLADTDLRAQVANIACPVRLLHGAHDALMPVEAARWLADTLPEARLTVFDAAGHAPFLSRPDDCATLISTFIDD